MHKHRWFLERDLMLRRWRLEIAKHEAWMTRNRPGYRKYNLFYDFAPIPPDLCDIDDPCHCYLGPGFFRKRHPFDCGRSKCGVCHGEKNYGRKNRFNKRREAIEFDLEADGWYDGRESSD